MKTKKRLSVGLSVVCAFLFCLGFFGVKADIAAQAEQSEESHLHCICGGDTDVGDHTEHSGETYTAWGGGDFDYDGADDKGAAYLYLTDDVVNMPNSCNRTDGDGILSIKEGQILYLCLNGHSLKNGNTGSNTIDIEGTLYLCDCIGNGTVGGRVSGSNSGAIWLGGNGKLNMFGGSITGSCGLKNGGGVYLTKSSSLVMYGGKISGNTAIRQAGGVYLTNSSSFVMYDGIISDNSAPDFGGGVIVDDGTSFTMNGGVIENNFSGRTGGGIFISGGTFTMNGGRISDNLAANGGGVAVSYDYGRGTFTMNGGSISGNTAFGSGGGVFVWDRATFTMNGGSISGNTAANGGGICMYAANKDNNNINNVFEMSAGEIKNNTASIFGGGVCCFEYSNIKFSENDTIVIAENGDTNVFFADKRNVTITGLAEGSSIGVSVLEKPKKGAPITICGLNDTEIYGKYFFSDSSDYVIKSDENGITLTADFFKVTVKYESGCDYVVPAQVVTGFDEALSVKITNEKPTMPCHNFLGWSATENADAAQYVAEDSVDVKGEMTLYAVWESVPHKLFSIEEKSATCEIDGVKGYYKCSECGKKFIDSEAKNEIASDEQLAIPHGHKFGVWQETVEPTTETEGVIAHKDCDVCGKHFDIDGVEITDLAIDKLPGESSSESSGDNESSKSCKGAIDLGSTIGSLFAVCAIAFGLHNITIKKNRKN